MTMTTHSAVVTLPSDTTIHITREFDAPRHLVYRAWTEPDLIRQWWHANRGTIVSIETDVRVGGSWRYVMTATGGFEVGFHGEYLDVVADERLVTTEYYEGAPGLEPARTTLTLTDIGTGRTRMDMLVEHASKANRDMHVDSGMEGGLQDALDMVDELAGTLAG
jgi:uncharacterized protein YndB with AHSA1/START domain